MTAPAFISIFKTSLQSEADKLSIEPHLGRIEGVRRWSVDLSDADKVLRVVSEKDVCHDIMVVSRALGYFCDILRD
ncbi:hypothetical protein [Chryseolinea lacunae]|uniref:Uncharacterized protein n=1 Tax=Chryseolinea lacunae TaxID=2801331 RepID=A0ABS1KLP3_9BACT|nr:hypothetical protein [Chryseolinea lacunae]MBL0740385.1 hypothetical protein [Chryseolinea lacunae]